MRQHLSRRRLAVRAAAVAGCASLVGVAALSGAAPGLAATSQPLAHQAAQAPQTHQEAQPRQARQALRAHSPAPATCHLANGVKHVIQLTFDNVHFFRDNPNVPSDLQMMPSLQHFLEGNGTLASNNHTPLIAHTANDLLTTFTGLYGDRAGMPVSNSYQTFNPNGTTDPAGSFAYWTDPVFDEASTPTAGHDTNPSLVYSATPPATTNPAPKPNKITPAPWVPFTRAGCDVGDVATVNQELENTSPDIPKVFGPNSPEAKQLANDPDSFKDAETADYVGLAVHCAEGSVFCSSASGVKYGQTKPSPTAVADVLPNEPGGYAGYQGLFGHRYVAPQLGAGTPNVTHHGYPVTNAAGNLVDENGNQINGAFLTNHPGFPGFGGITASQTLAYIADLQESGVPVTSGYISDLHGNHHIPGLSACNSAPAALGPGDPCYVAQAQYYNRAFTTFFKRLAADGITAKNTLFILSSDEGDHVAGANVGRAVQPTPSTCNGATVSGNTVTPAVACTYPAGTFGELDGNLTGMLATQAKNTTPFSLENDTAPEFYVTGNPAVNSTTVRSLERAVGGLTAANPYTKTTQKVTNYLADPTEEAILHMVNADPARTPTFAMFARPDYYLFAGSASCGGPCVTQNTGFAYDHGDYAAEINTNWLGIAGPGVAHLGIDGSAANAGPSSAGANSGQVTVPGSGTKGTWIDETDLRPTLMYLTGLKDDYEHDGRVISQLLTHPNGALSAPGIAALGECYKQLNSSVGQFGTATLQASTKAIESTSPGDKTYLHMDQALAALDKARDGLAGHIKGELEAAAFSGTAVHGAQWQLAACKGLIRAAQNLAS
ncbi:MAG TPA: hypothetical protein VG253_12265 [Streptosporangiaceae bacterium]|nr:hypothetical protein [Streptosporangiaceae bacterium]